MKIHNFSSRWICYILLIPSFILNIIFFLIIYNYYDFNKTETICYSKMTDLYALNLEEIRKDDGSVTHALVMTEYYKKMFAYLQSDNDYILSFSKELWALISKNYSKDSILEANLIIEKYTDDQVLVLYQKLKTRPVFARNIYDYIILESVLRRTRKKNANRMITTSDSIRKWEHEYNMRIYRSQSSDIFTKDH